MLPHVARITGKHHHAPSLVEMGSHELFVQLASNYDPLYLGFLKS
jgi:hypothetical protein